LLVIYKDILLGTQHMSGEVGPEFSLPVRIIKPEAGHLNTSELTSDSLTRLT